MGLLVLPLVNLSIVAIHISDQVFRSFDIYLRFLLILVSQIEHAFEDVLLIELNFLHFIVRHVCEVYNKADHICGVAFEIVVSVLADGVFPPLRICAWNVHEFIRVEGIGEDIIIVD